MIIVIMKGNLDMSKKINPLFWFFDTESAKGRKYRKDLCDLKNNSLVNLLVVSGHAGIQFEYPEVFHDMLEDIVSFAHSIDIKIALHLIPSIGFFNADTFGGPIPEVDQAQLFPITDPSKASALVCDYETILDDCGKATITHKAKWARPKIAPIYCRVISAYSFEKDGDGFYKSMTLCDVTDKITVIDNRTDALVAEVDCGAEFANQTLFVMTAQYYNYSSLFGYSQYENFKRVLDGYADIPLDGFALDEFGYLYLDCRESDAPFRGRLYSEGMKKYYREKLGIDVHRLLFDMRYAPTGKGNIRIQAINRYFEELRKPPAENEKKILSYAKKIYGEDIYFGTHATFHNNLAADEIWHTGCDWWDVPTVCGHTDENIGFPVRMGIMLSRKTPFSLDMFYSKNEEEHFRHIVKGAPFGCREFHHALNDYLWGHSFTEPDFLKKIYALDSAVEILDDFIVDYPRLDLAVVFGAAAQFNWFPDESVRNRWDVDGSLNIQRICDSIWNQGYRCALIPDYTVCDGRMTLEGGKVCFGDYSFDKVIFLYPKYADRRVYDFFNNAYAEGVCIAAVGRADIDFCAENAILDAPVYENFDINILNSLHCEKSAIPDGCVYRDGSFSIVTECGILEGKNTDFSFEIDGNSYCGNCTGVIAYRKGGDALGTKGGVLKINGKEILYT